MAHRLTLAKARNHRLIREFAGVSCDSDEMRDRINDAQRTLLEAGEWWGTYQRFLFCAKEGCVRVVPHIARILAATVEGVQIQMRDEFFRFTDFVYPTDGELGGRNWADSQGEFPLFSDLGSTAKFIRIYNERPEDIGVEVLIKGYGADNQRIQSVESGSVIDGIRVTVASPSATSPVKFSSVTSIQSDDVRSGDLNFWWLDDDGNQNAIAVLYPQWDNTWYRQYKFPWACDNQTITAIVKLEHWDTVRDEDFLIIQSPEALAHQIKAHQYEAAEDPGRAAQSRQRAYEVLSNQLTHYRGLEKTIQIQRNAYARRAV